MRIMDFVSHPVLSVPVSRLCFGTLTIGPLQAGLPIDEGANVIVRALDLGVNILDTAQLYRTYPYIRRALEKWGGRRGDIVISSKSYDYTAEGVRGAVREALDAMGTDYIDIFMLHEQESIHTLRGHGEALDELRRMKESGVVRAVGVSTHHVAGVYGALECGGIDVVHPLYNMAGLGIIGSSGDPAGALGEMGAAIRAASEAGLFVLGMKALGGGNLYRDAAAALGFVLDSPHIHSVALGMKSVREVEANAHFFSTRSFPGGYSPDGEPRRLHIEAWCGGCAACVPRCAARALSAVDGRARVNAEACLLCGYCAAACESFALKMV
jgi:aryl-alcohol dehydrogenase-like predicted oxidoreductase/NAD-dependent dihydropyrimidine dehydrogenase PreA subunit